jgi:hypothetical protein
MILDVCIHNVISTRNEEKTIHIPCRFALLGCAFTVSCSRLKLHYFGYSFTSLFKNFQSGFKDAINASFFSLRHFFISFSLAIA